MEKLNSELKDTILKLADTVPELRTNTLSLLHYTEFWQDLGDDSYYSDLGRKVLNLIEEDTEFAKMKKLNYLWAVEKEHPIIRFSATHRANVQKESEHSDLTIVDLFSGAGGLSLGFIQNGFEISLANDIDDSCISTYVHNHPSVPEKHVVHGDISEIIDDIKNYSRFDNIDVVIGGPPCQGFSMANRQRIKDDPRNKLYKYFIQAVDILQPKVIVMENVKGMLKVAEQVVEDFSEIGYFTEYKILNAADFSVPQNRERLIFIGTKNENGPSTIFKDIENIKDESDYFVLKDALFNLPVLEASRTKNATSIYDESGGLVQKVSDNKSNSYINLINSDKEQFVVLNGKARYNNDRDIEIFGRLDQGEDSTSNKIADIMPYKSRSHIFKDKYYKLRNDNICKTITAHMRFDCNMYIHPTQARGLTPREAARVQSFPDDYFFQGAYTKTYMQIGNSVPPLLGRAISKGVKRYLREDSYEL